MIYLDNASSCPMYNESIKATQRALLLDFANPSASHGIGQKLHDKILSCKHTILRELNADPSKYDLIFTSSATESNNQAIKSLPQSSTVYFTTVDHKSITQPISYFHPDNHKTISLDDRGHLDFKALPSNSAFVFSHVNSLSGHIEPIDKIIPQLPDAVFHIDATQSFGKFNIDLQKSPVTTLTISAHKMGGPKGVAALIYKKDFPLQPLMYGGAQQTFLRSSTLPTALIIGWHEAIKLATEKQNREFEKVLSIKTHLIKTLNYLLQDEVKIFFDKAHTSPYINLIATQKVPSDVLMRFLEQDDIYVSSVSACSSKQKKNPALEAFNIPPALRKNTLRISFSYKTNAFEVNQFCESLSAHYKRLKLLTR